MRYAFEKPERSMSRRRSFLALCFLPIALQSCSSQRPVLYPNQQLQRVGSGAADRDINECMERAEQYISSGGGSDTLEQAAVGGGAGATIGAAAGAAGGAVWGHAGTGAAAGAAGGGAAGVTRGLIRGLTRKRSPSPVYKSFVNRCLREKGYDPIGWQ
jgi:hypothetical protein